jgi:hypothetical protein
MFSFVTDRKAQGSLGGQYAPVADQTKFRSVYGVISGPMSGHPWSGRMIESGQIISADGKASIGGTEARDAEGKPHDITQGTTTLREYKIPVEDLDKWNAYEAAQANNQAKQFMDRENAKAIELGRKPEIETEDITEEIEGAQFETTGATEKPKRTMSPEHKAKLAAGRAAKKAQGSTA